MSSPRHRLDVLLKRAKRRRRVDGSFVRDVVATTRELIEAHRAQSDFPITTLYCNWSLHTQISGSLTALRCLVEVSRRKRTIIDTHQDVGHFLRFLSEQVFQVDTLRTELLALCRQFDLSDYLFRSDANWKLFAALLLDGLIGKKLQYPPGADLAADPSDKDQLRKAKRLLGEVRALTNEQPRQMFKAAWITLAIDPWDDRPEADKSPVFHCNVQPFEGAVFSIRMTNVVPLPEADDYPLST